MSARNDSEPAVEWARRLRRETTALERALWFRIRKEQLGFRFRRQYPAGRYTLDFYCPSVRLCVEIDGPMHDAERDARRDAYLADAGIATLRFKSQEVYDDIEPVVEKIRLVRPPPPRFPLPLLRRSKGNHLRIDPLIRDRKVRLDG